MSTPTAADMVTMLMTALAAGGPTITAVTTDGTQIQYDRAAAIEELKFWKRLAAREAGTRPVSMGVNLSNFMPQS